MQRHEILALASQPAYARLFDRFLLHNPAFILALAETMDASGDGEQAIALCRASSIKGDAAVEIARLVVSLLLARGRLVEAIEVIAEVKKGVPDIVVLMDDIKRLMALGIERFNQDLAAGEVTAAATVIGALAAMVSNHEGILSAALAVSQMTDDRLKIQIYAQSLMQLDPHHPKALAALDLLRGGAAAAPISGAHPEILLRLWTLHQDLSRLLCAPLTADSRDKAAALLEQARSVTLPVQDETDEMLGWARHYRLMIDAFDLPGLSAPTPAPRPFPPLDIADSQGRPISADELAERARPARVVFLVAADERYVGIYAHWYAASILKSCDVPCVVILHVIGGIGRLAETAATVAIDDPRLVLCGDRFDAAALTTRCYDAPPKGLLAHPAAHYQSSRFIWLGYYLDLLRRPVFVSDIDTLLQRGVGDLLDRHRDSDVVLNENGGSKEPGAKLTANLVLLLPSEAGQAFARYLRGYLETALAGEAVTRWIDQVGLLFARHHLQNRPGGAPARIGYFDTESDINNRIYPDYRDNPFRFLSLYHGFNLDSLKGVL